MSDQVERIERDDGGVELYYRGEWRLRTTPDGYEVKCPRCGATNTHRDKECGDCSYPLGTYVKTLMDPPA